MIPKKAQRRQPFAFDEFLIEANRLPVSSSSHFYDRAEDYPLSDWMFAFALGEGLGDPEEFHLGGLPDLSSIIRFDLESVLNRAEKRNTKFYKFFKKYLSANILVDLGSGIPSRSVSPRILAEVVGAEGYIGVDLCHASNEIRREEFKWAQAFPSVFVRADHLDFLALLKAKVKILKRGFCFLLSGIELVDFDSSEGKDYCRNLLTSVVECMDERSALILCVSSRDFFPSEFGLKLVYADPYHEFFAKKGRFF